MKVKRIISLIKEADKHASLEYAAFGRLGTRDAVLKFEDGRLVTESNVTDFIRERVRAHHNSWVRGPIQTALKLLQE